MLVKRKTKEISLRIIKENNQFVGQFYQTDNKILILSATFSQIASQFIVNSHFFSCDTFFKLQVKLYLTTFYDKFGVKRLNIKKARGEISCYISLLKTGTGGIRTHDQGIMSPLRYRCATVP